MRANDAIDGEFGAPDRSAMIETSILIPTKNGAQDIDACLEAIFSQKGVGPLEVLVVDSGSTDATTEIARRYPVRLEQIAPVQRAQIIELACL